MLEKLKLQHEMLDTERKVFQFIINDKLICEDLLWCHFQMYEDLEFQLMEGVAHREVEREELHKEMAALELRISQRKHQVREVEQQQRQAAHGARDEAQDLDIKRRDLFQQIEQVRFVCCYINMGKLDAKENTIIYEKTKLLFRRNQNLTCYRTN